MAYAARSVAGWWAVAGVGHLTGQSSIQQRRARPSTGQLCQVVAPSVGQWTQRRHRPGSRYQHCVLPSTGTGLQTSSAESGAAAGHHYALRRGGMARCGPSAASTTTTAEEDDAPVSLSASPALLSPTWTSRPQPRAHWSARRQHARLIGRSAALSRAGAVQVQTAGLGSVGAGIPSREVVPRRSQDDLPTDSA